VRRYLVAGNWKLNKGPAAARELAQAVRDGIADGKGADVLICPPYVSIPAAAEAADGEPLLLGAQDCSVHDQGAYTGEVSAELLRDAGCRFVIVGHSERREYHRENDDQFVAKIERVHAAGMTAIFCFGELLEDRRAGRAESVVRAQLEGVLPRITRPDADNLVLAYEPVWAIGTGETATPDIAQAMHAVARGVVEELLGDVAARMRLLYGGSCKPSNAAELFRKPDVDGGLIGGASLKADDFLGIVEAAAELS
jgi:triosephosphate isomerase